MIKHHLKSGHSDLEWFAMAIEEAKNDPVGLWAIVKEGRQGFGLDDRGLESFVKDYIVALIQSGAVPVVGDKTASFGWRPQYQYGNDPKNVAEFLVSEWRKSQVDPDVNGVWFACPSVWS